MKQHRKWTDEEILNTFYASVEGRERMLYYIFHESGWRKQVIKFVVENSGTMEDAKDIMQEALVGFLKSLTNGKYEGQGALQGYFFGIAKHKWHDELEKRKKRVKTNTLTDKNDVRQNNPSEDNADKRLLEEDRRKLLIEVVKKLGYERCLRLRLEAGAGATGEELARRFGFKDPDKVKKFKSDCWKSFLKELENFPDLENLLLEEFDGLIQWKKWT